MTASPTTPPAGPPAGPPAEVVIMSCFGPDGPAQTTLATAATDVVLGWAQAGLPEAIDELIRRGALGD